MMNLHKNKLDYLPLLFIPFIGMIVLVFFVRINTMKYNYALFFGIFCALMLLLIAITAIPYFSSGSQKTSSKKKKKTPAAANIPLLVSWLALGGLMLYSDIMVSKKYFFVSILLLVLFTAVFILLRNYSNEDKDRYLGIFMKSVEISFIAASILCFLFRPYTSGARYSGLSINPNVYAKYLVTVWACLTADLDHSISARKPLYKCIPIGIELGVAVFFLYMTGARTSFLAIAALTALWFIIRLVICRKTHLAVMRYIVTAILVMLVSFFASYGILATLPNLINRPIQFQRDEIYTAGVGFDWDYVCAAQVTPYASNGPDVLDKAAEDVSAAIENADKEPSLFKRIGLAFNEGSNLDTILNGRLSIYKSFAGKLNYKGHRLYSRKVNGTNLVAHNNILQIGYTYGILAMIPYILVNILSFVLSVIFYVRNHGKRRNAAFPMLLITGFLITSLTESVMNPVQSLLAFTYFLCVGYLMYSSRN